MKKVILASLIAGLFAVNAVYAQEGGAETKPAATTEAPPAADAAKEGKHHGKHHHKGAGKHHKGKHAEGAEGAEGEAK